MIVFNVADPMVVHYESSDAKIWLSILATNDGGVAAVPLKRCRFIGNGRMTSVYAGY